MEMWASQGSNNKHNIILIQEKRTCGIENCFFISFRMPVITKILIMPVSIFDFIPFSSWTTWIEPIDLFRLQRVYNSSLNLSFGLLICILPSGFVLTFDMVCDVMTFCWRCGCLLFYNLLLFPIFNCILKCLWICSFLMWSWRVYHAVELNNIILAASILLM
jgi:hypothetical protein